MSKQKQKGTAYETAVVRYLQDNGFPHAERSPLYGSGDRGDITGCPGIVWECKNHKSHDLAGWLRETEQERINANADFGVLTVKRAGVGDIGQQYAVMTLEQMCRLLILAGYGKEQE
jgi:hypothetical protein